MGAHGGRYIRSEKRYFKIRVNRPNYSLIDWDWRNSGLEFGAVILLFYGFSQDEHIESRRNLGNHRVGLCRAGVDLTE